MALRVEAAQEVEWVVARLLLALGRRLQPQSP
jgi:hypothetical protein